ncbi:unnamed protein product [Spirodela intermedia]|nr:unnamed protein product [Spirodela intermedia]CAA6665572.1 unnamed protein product [Spirodela intermedia]
MAANRTKGWAGDSFDRYMEYRFCITVNILAFVYSGFQAYAQVHRLISDKDIIPLPIRLYFDFAMDQVLAYLLIAAATAAATRNTDWVTNWGSDPFTVMANGSISVSFLAFAALAISALISAFILFSKIP